MKPKIDAIHKFRITYADRIRTIEFIPSNGVPGFSHQVAFNGYLTRKYLGSQFKPTKKNALDMADLVKRDFPTVYDLPIVGCNREN